MANKYTTSIFIFRRDLRLHDNTALIACAKQSHKIIPIFIYDPRQVTDKNKFKSNNAVQFMCESIQDLKIQLKEKNGKLYEFYGHPEKVLTDLIINNKIDSIFFNKDYTPFALTRDQKIEFLCKKHRIAYYTFNDSLLNPPQALLTKNRTPFRMFGAFFKQARKIVVQKPKKVPVVKFVKKTIKSQFTHKPVIYTKNNQIIVHGGSTQAHKILHNIKQFTNYKQQRDYPSTATTHLSAHLKFGTVSARTVYYTITKTLGVPHELIRQLYWRDFFTYLAYHHPHVFKKSFKSQFDQLSWNTNKKLFMYWCIGKTGFPIVDAGMRELNKTGFMHNRVRMIVASFLTKDLLINWQWGEKYFATMLVDYDPAVNNGNWQWIASTGADAQPYFRIFNPWIQQKKFDYDCRYIKKWVPELEQVSPKILHTWYRSYKLANKRYPKPIVNHEIQRRKALAFYKNFLTKKELGFTPALYNTKLR